jgi:tetratricopeptide (TPR) repeat protein
MLGKLATVVVCFAVTASIQADDRAAVVGKRFMPKHGCEIKNGKDVVTMVSAPYTVRAVEAGRYDVGAGWVRRDDVVALEDAVDYYTQYLRAHPDSSWAYNHRGIAWNERGESEIAVRDFSDAIRLDPKYARAYCNRAVVFQSQKEYARASKDFDEALRVDPTYSLAHLGRARLHLVLNDYEQAARDFDEAIRVDPDSVAAYVGRANLRAALKDSARALDDFAKALAIDPTVPSTWSSRGFVYYVQSDYEKAIRDFDESLRLDPRQSQVYLERAKAREKSGDLKRAHRDYDEALRIDARFAEAYFRRGELERRRGEFAKALADLDRAARLRPNDNYVASSLAWTLAVVPTDELRDGRRAVELATKACERSQWNEGLYLEVLAAAYAEVGDFEKAVARQERAVELIRRQNGRVQLSEKLLALFRDGKPYRIPKPTK